MLSHRVTPAIGPCQLIQFCLNLDPACLQQRNRQIEPFDLKSIIRISICRFCHIELDSSDVRRLQHTRQTTPAAVSTGHYYVVNVPHCHERPLCSKAELWCPCPRHLLLARARNWWPPSRPALRLESRFAGGTARPPALRVAEPWQARTILCPGAMIHTLVGSLLLTKRCTPLGVYSSAGPLPCLPSRALQQGLDVLQHLLRRDFFVELRCICHDQ